jgi:hypothetical protein
MTSRKHDKEIVFLDGRNDTFEFECGACGRCCGEFTIILTPYDIIRLRRATGHDTDELVNRGIIYIERMQFKKAFGFGPVAAMFEALGVSQNDVIPVALLGLKADSLGKSACEFLSPPGNGRRLCGVYEHRPGMCRLHPLGCVTVDGEREWFFRKPLCDAGKGKTHTVESWLDESEMEPYLEANARYLTWMQDLLGHCELFSSVAEGDWKKLEMILFGLSRDGTTSTTMDTIEEEFRQWLSSVFKQ